MFKIALEHENLKINIEDTDALDIFEAMEVIHSVLLACGFHADSLVEGYEEMLERYKAKENKNVEDSE